MATDDELARATVHDHQRAGERGERLRLLTNSIMTMTATWRHDTRTMRLAIFHLLADDIYGNRAIDIPEDL